MKFKHRFSLIGTFLLAAVLLIAGARPASATDFPGPDDFGYTGVEIEDPEKIGLRDISSSGSSVSLGDDQVTVPPLQIGFTFNYYGIDYTQFRISSNGFIILGSASPSSGFPPAPYIPYMYSPNNVIAGWWEDLNPSQGGDIVYQTVGSAGSLELIVGFYDVPHYYYGSEVTFEIVLHEGTNEIEIQCSDCPSPGAGRVHTVGIENYFGTVGLEILRTSGSQYERAWLLSTRQFPIAKAGPDQIVFFDEVNLDGSKSDDPDGTIESYEWELQYRDRDNPQYDRTAEGVNPTVSDLESGFYDVTLTVIYNDVFTATDTMLLAVAVADPCEAEERGLASSPQELKELATDTLFGRLPTGNDKTYKGIEKAIEHIEKSLAPELWETDSTLTMKGKKVFKEEKKAVKELIKIHDPDVSDIIDSLVGIDERLARRAIDQAVAEAEAAGCYDEDHDDRECDKALNEIVKAMDEMAKTIDRYKKAWEHAQKAMDKVPEPEK